MVYPGTIPPGTANNSKSPVDVPRPFSGASPYTYLQIVRIWVQSIHNNTIILKLNIILALYEKIRVSSQLYSWIINLTKLHDRLRKDRWPVKGDICLEIHTVISDHIMFSLCYSYWWGKRTCITWLKTTSNGNHFTILHNYVIPRLPPRERFGQKFPLLSPKTKFPVN